MSDEAGYTVVVPTFQMGSTLPATLASVLTQSVPPDQVIVVDDGSTDDTVERVRELPQVCLIRQANRGTSAARNAGIAAVTSPYLAFVDADDVWHPRAAEVLLAAITTSRAAVVSGRGVPFQYTGAPAWPRLDQGEVSLLDLRRLLHRSMLVNSATIYRTEVLRSVGGFDESLRACVDLDVALRILEAGHSIGLSPAVVAGIRQTPGSISRNPRGVLEAEIRVVVNRMPNDSISRRAAARWRAELAWLRALARASHEGHALSEVTRLSAVLRTGHVQRAVELLVCRLDRPLRWTWHHYRELRPRDVV